MAKKIWVKLDSKKQPLLYDYSEDNYVANLVEEVLKKEKVSEFSASDVKVYYMKEGDENEVNFTMEVSELAKDDIGSSSNLLRMKLPEGMTYSLCMVYSTLNFFLIKSNRMAI